MGCSNSKAAASTAATATAGDRPPRPADVPTSQAATEPVGVNHAQGTIEPIAPSAFTVSTTDRNPMSPPAVASPNFRHHHEAAQSTASTPNPTAATAAITEMEPELVVPTSVPAHDEPEVDPASGPAPEPHASGESCSAAGLAPPSSGAEEPTAQDSDQTATSGNHQGADSLQLATITVPEGDPTTVPSTPVESPADPPTEPETPGDLAAQESPADDGRPPLDPILAPSSTNDSTSSNLPPATRKGIIHKQGHLLKNWKPRFFVLEKGEIRYYLPSNATMPTPKDKKGELNLKNCSVIVEGSRISIFGTEALNSKGQTELNMSISYPNELAEWVAAIKEHIAYINAK